MRDVWKNQKKSIGLTLILTLFLIGVDQLLKWIIFTFDRASIDNCNGSKFIFHYHPVFNEKGSFLNLKLNLEYNYPLFLGITFMGIILCVYLLCYFLKAKQLYCSGYGIMLPVVFFLAACGGRLVERILWRYTLDYIAIRNMGILDLIDIYLVLGCAGLLMVACYIQWMENKLKKSVV